VGESDEDMGDGISEKDRYKTMAQKPLTGDGSTEKEDNDGSTQNERRDSGKTMSLDDVVQKLRAATGTTAGEGTRLDKGKDEGADEAYPLRSASRRLTEQDP
jgi:hypothetical protein